MAHRTALGFGEFVFDRERSILSRHGEPVHIGHRALAVLEVLLESPGEVVDKRRLLDTVWSDAVVVEDNLVQAVHELRSVLGDSARRPRYIETVHRRGYRLVASVREVEVGPSVTATAAAKPARRRGRTLLLWAAAAGALGGLAILLLSLPSGSGESASSLQPGAVLHKLAADFLKPAVSPSGTLIAAVGSSRGAGASRLFVISRDGTRRLPLAPGMTVHGPSPVFSADGSEIWFTTYIQRADRGLTAQVWSVPVMGGEPRLLLDQASAASPSPDGRCLVYAAVGASGTSIRVRCTGREELELVKDGYWPRWSPDGRWIAYTTSNPEGGDGHLFVVSPDGTRRRRLTSRASQLYGLGWTPDSRRVLFGSDLRGSDDIWAVDLRGRGLVQLTKGPGSCSAPVADPRSGSILFSYGTQEVTVTAVDLASSPPRLTSLATRDDIFDLDADPSGERVVWAAADQGTGPYLEYLDRETGDHGPLGLLAADRCRLCGRGAILAAAPSLDGSTSWIWRAATLRTPARPLLDGTGGWLEAAPLGSEDLAVLRRLPDGSAELCLVNPATGSCHPLARHRSMRDLRVSPDGAWIAWSGGLRPADSSSGGIWIVRVHGGGERRVTADGASPAWDSSGARLFFVRTEKLGGVWSLPLSGGAPRLEWRPGGAAAGSRVERLAVVRDSLLYLTLVTESPAVFEIQAPNLG